MPGVDGFELVRRIKMDPAFSPLAVIMVSSSGLPADARRARDLGVGAFLVKPLTPLDLVTAVENLVPAAGPFPVRAEPAPAVVPVTAERNHRLRVLLAEDNAVNQTVVYRACSNDSAMTSSSRARAAPPSPPSRRTRSTFVLMDVEMPDLDGLEATVAIRAAEAGAARPGRRLRHLCRPHRGRRIPIVALTAHAMRGSSERCLAAGMDAFLAKPFKAAELASMIGRFTGEAASRTRSPGRGVPSSSRRPGARRFQPRAVVRVRGPAIDGVAAGLLASRGVDREALRGGRSMEQEARDRESPPGDLTAHTHQGHRRGRRRRGRRAPGRNGPGAGRRTDRAAEHRHQPAARFRPGGAPTTYFTDPDVLTVDPLSTVLRQPNSADPAPVDRRALVGGPGLERPGPLSGLERHPQQPAAALAGGRRPRERLPHARRTTATAIPSTSRAGSSRASTSRGASSATSTTARSP